MANETEDLFPPINTIVLSRSELLAILSLLEIESIPGFGADPIGDLSPEQIAYGIICGERALRARGLAGIDEEGHLLIRNGVLEMVAVCAYARHSIFVTHVLAPSGTARQYNGHHIDERFVAHSIPEAALHLFSASADRTAMTEQITEFCDWRESPDMQSARIDAPTDILASVRDLVEDQKLEAAHELLLDINASIDVARRLVSLLDQPHSVSIVQAIQPHGEDSITLQSATVLQSENELWLMVEAQPDADQSALYTLQTATVTQIEETLSGMEW